MTRLKKEIIVLVENLREKRAFGPEAVLLISDILVRNGIRIRWFVPQNYGSRFGSGPEYRSEHIMTNPNGPKKFGSDGSRSGSGPQHSSEESMCLVDRVEDVWKRLWVAKAEDKKCMSKTHFNLAVFIFFVIWTLKFLHWSIIREE
jgi:hypothetical protein